MQDEEGCHGALLWSPKWIRLLTSVPESAVVPLCNVHQQMMNGNRRGGGAGRQRGILIPSGGTTLINHAYASIRVRSALARMVCQPCSSVQ